GIASGQLAALAGSSGRPPANSALLELLEPAFLVLSISHEPPDQSREDERDHGIRGPDECSVRSEVHGATPQAGLRGESRAPPRPSSTTSPVAAKSRYAWP